MKLNARQVDTAKPKEKPYKLADGGGLYLLVNPNGAKYWRLKYRVAGKEKLLALGVYPDVTLAVARSKRDEAKRGIAGGIDPNEAKREEKATREAQVNNTFHDIATEWHSSKLKKWSPGYASDIMEAFKKCGSVAARFSVMQSLLAGLNITPLQISLVPCRGMNPTIILS